jgi:hypothetical protein
VVISGLHGRAHRGLRAIIKMDAGQPTLTERQVDQA